jgi:excisionase family DNA binding protein
MMQLLTLWQVGECLGLSRSTVARMVARKKLPGVVRIGGAVRVDKRALDKWIEEKKEG